MTVASGTLSYASPSAGVRLAAGLAWKSAAADPGWRIGASGLALVSGDGRSASGGRYARTQDPAAEGARSLLMAMARGLAGPEDGAEPPEPGDWLFAARTDPEPGHPDGRYWLAQASVTEAEGGGSVPLPLPRPEEIRDSFEGLVQAAAGIASVWIVPGLAVPDTDPFAGRIAEALADAGVFDPSRIRRVPLRADGLPAFERIRRLPVTAAAAAAVAMGGALAAAVVLPGFLSSLLAAPPPPSVPLATVAVAEGAFRTECSRRLSDWWPRIAGWRPAVSGCALAGHAPAGLEAVDAVEGGSAGGGPSVTMLSWQRLSLADGANPVLAGGAADRVLAGWTHGVRRDGDGLLLWRASLLPLVPADGRDAAAASGRPLEALWAGTPGAVRAGQGGYEVTAPGDPDDLLARASLADGLEPVRIEVPEAGSATMALRPPEFRAVPASSLPLHDSLPLHERTDP